MRIPLIIILALCFGFPCAALEAGYDVIVAGGGVSGTAAAIQAARQKAGVLVVEPSSWIGGQATAAGVSNMDDLLPTRSGLYRSFIAKLRRCYDKKGKSMGTSYWNARSVAFEPSLGQKIFYEMLDEARNFSGKPLDIFLRAEIIRVRRNGNAVTGVTVRERSGKSREINCRVLIDATEYGDVLPLAGAGYRAGNSASPSIDPEAIIQDITWVAIIKNYKNRGGVPRELRAIEPLPGYEQAGEIYRRYVTADGGTFGGTYPIRLPVDFVTHNAYRGLPDSSAKNRGGGRRENWRSITKAGVNWGNDYPGHVIKTMPGLPVKYLEDAGTRAQMEREAFIKTLHFIYYIQNELGEPWSVADDEYYDAESPVAESLPETWREIARRMPPIPYVRESRRIVGDYTLTSEAIFRNSRNYADGKNSEFKDSIGVGRYGLDLHGANAAAHMEKDLNESYSSILNNSPKAPFQVPLRILIPRGAEGLLAAEKNLSMSRVASGALRVQPICMLTGQAAGALAALAANDGVAPGKIAPARVQKELLEAGVVLSLSEFMDVPPKNKYYKAVQLASLYGLIDPVVPPLPGRSRAIFGVNRPVTGEEAAAMSREAELAFGIENLNIAPGLTRGEALELIYNGIPEE